MTHKLGELPTLPREAYAEKADWLATAMRHAIPPEDVGSRGAITYALDIVEMLAYYHIDLTPFDVDPKELADFIAGRKHWLDQTDPKGTH